LPVDPCKVQTQGLEHSHKKRKATHLRVTNFTRPGTKNADGPFKRARTQQVMSHITVEEGCQRLTFNLGKHNVIEERKRRKKEQSRKARVRRLKRAKEEIETTLMTDEEHATTTTSNLD
jgi:hypothetical protein